ncbi:hypothetical protein CL619_04630 [archaeon]|nr:hypothetical protein [archaeon]|tara:strand:+ start:720 stop:986 length:267 start_codon:yes stop_codon:yes gene_type:complete
MSQERQGFDNSQLDDAVNSQLPWGRLPGRLPDPQVDIYRFPIQDRVDDEDRRPHAPSPLPPGAPRPLGGSREPENEPERGYTIIDYSI